MDTFVEDCYITGYETIWNTPSIGATTASRHRVARIWPQLPFCGRSGTLIVEFGCALASVVPETRTEGITCQSKPWTTTVAEHQAKDEVAPDLVAWAAGSWLRDRSVDTSEDWRCDRHGIWDTVFACQLLEVDDRLRVELSETRKACQGTQRAGHPQVEAVGVAAYKKTLNVTDPIWFFWTKADFCWCLRSFERGHRGVTLHCCVWQESGPRYLPFRPSVFLRCENDQHCISNSTPTKTSEPSKWSCSFGTCCDIFGEVSFCCGTEVELTGPASLNSSCTHILDSMITSFQGTLQSSTPMNWSGLSSNERWQTVFPTISAVFASFLHEKLDGCNVPQKGCVHAFVPLICQCIEYVSII